MSLIRSITRFTDPVRGLRTVARTGVGMSLAILISLIIAKTPLLFDITIQASTGQNAVFGTANNFWPLNH